MRRIVLVPVFLAIVGLGIPSPALAWWDFFEQFSGPGKFYGWDLQTRLFCLVDKIPVDEKGRRAEGQVQTEAFIPPVVGIITSTCRAEEVRDKIKYKNRLSVDVVARFVWADDNPRFANGQRISLTTLEPMI